MLLSSVQTPSESVKQRDYQKHCKHACGQVNTQQSDHQFTVILVRGVRQFRRVTTEPRSTHVVGVFTEGVVHSLLKDKGRDKIPPDLAALKDQEKYAEVSSHNSVLCLTVELCETDSSSGQVGTF